MSSVREGRLWSWLDGARFNLRKRLHMTRVENLVVRGTPDVEGCLDGVGFWIELKCSARPADGRTPIRVRFERGQLQWLKRRWEAGGRSFVLLQVGHGSSASRYLVPGNLAGLMEHGQEGPTEAALSDMSVIDPKAKDFEVVLRAAR